MKANYKHTRIFKIYDPQNPNLIYLTITANIKMKEKTILKSKYKSNQTKTRHSSFFQNEKLKCEYLSEMKLKSHSEVAPHFFIYCNDLESKTGVNIINKTRFDTIVFPKKNDPLSERKQCRSSETVV